MSYAHRALIERGQEIAETRKRILYAALADGDAKAREAAEREARTRANWHGRGPCSMSVAGRRAYGGSINNSAEARRVALKAVNFTPRRLAQSDN
jgi:hypothetical protein